jgi:hypothetical protein
MRESPKTVFRNWVDGGSPVFCVDGFIVVPSSGVGFIGFRFSSFSGGERLDSFVWSTAASSGNSQFQTTLHALRFSASSIRI